VFIALLAEAAWTLGCTSGSVSSSQPPPPPPTIAVTVNPTNASVLLGNQATFTATVTNTSDTAVSWSINGVPGGNATLGTITSAGVYTAPVDMPSPATVQVTATSHADSTKSGTGTLVITSDIALSLCPIRAGHLCKGAWCQQRTSASRLGRGPDLEESPESRVPSPESRVPSSEFRVPSFHFLFSIFVRSKPAAAEEKARAKRSQENRPAIVARLLLSDPQSFMQCCAAGG